VNRRFAGAISGAMMMTSLHAPAIAAQTGMTGYVREDSTGRPISGAEVAIRRVGYLPSGVMVQVTAGELRSKDFSLERSTPTLDTLKVTGRCRYFSTAPYSGKVGASTMGSRAAITFTTGRRRSISCR
jgi:hypothetical protein